MKQTTLSFKANVANILVSKKEQKIEEFLKDIIDGLSADTTTTSSASDLARLWKEEAKKKISQHSVTLFHRFEPLIKILLEQKLKSFLDESFATITTIDISKRDMANQYQRCFDTWVDAEACVTFKATNTRLLGQVSPKDMFILTFFIFCTCRRVKNDNLLQLGLVGCSTSGKSTLFESCLMEGSHVTTSEQGVGRFHVGDKTILMFHDVDVRLIAASKETEKIKTIARTEPTVTKIHGTVYSLNPTFLFYSSNERLMTHQFGKWPPMGIASTSCAQFRVLFHSQVQRPGCKRVTDETLTAIQNRFVEAFVRSPPPLQASDLPASGGFQRIHGILGIYQRILNLMEKYQPSDFTSPVVRQYILQGLASNHTTFKQVYDKDLSASLTTLIEKHIDVPLRQSILSKL